MKTETEIKEELSKQAGRILSELRRVQGLFLPSEDNMTLSVHTEKNKRGYFDLVVTVQEFNLKGVRLFKRDSKRGMTFVVGTGRELWNAIMKIVDGVCTNNPLGFGYGYEVRFSIMVEQERT